MTTRTVTEGLALFSLGIGALEVALAPRLSSALGLDEQENLVRAFGLREIVSGVGLLLALRGPARAWKPWIWARIGGDALDSAALGWALRSGNPKRGNALLAMLLVSPIIALDVWAALDLNRTT